MRVIKNEYTELWESESLYLPTGLPATIFHLCAINVATSFCSRFL